mgnify:CR=1 FL=1
MVETGTGIQEEKSMLSSEKEVFVKKKQYDFENLNLGDGTGAVEEKPKTYFKDYLRWIIVGLVMVVLIILVFVFDLI